MYKLGYILAWAVLGPLVVIVSTILCPFVLSAGLFIAVKKGWPKTPSKGVNYNLTPPPKEITIQN